MAVSTKKLRPITVDGVKYRWKSVGDDGVVELLVVHESGKGQILRAFFKYYSDLIPIYQFDGSTSGYHIYQRLQITPGLVRASIEEGLATGWQPATENNTPFIVRLPEAAIIPFLKRQSGYPELTDGEVALAKSTVGTGKLLALSGFPYTRPDDVFEKHPSFEAARAAARIYVQSQSDIACWLSTEIDRAIYLVESDGEADFRKKKDENTDIN